VSWRWLYFRSHSRRVRAAIKSLFFKKYVASGSFIPSYRYHRELADILIVENGAGNSSNFVFSYLFGGDGRRSGLRFTLNRGSRSKHVLIGKFEFKLYMPFLLKQDN
jgi:hypothetical protein